MFFQNWVAPADANVRERSMETKMNVAHTVILIFALAAAAHRNRDATTLFERIGPLAFAFVLPEIYLGQALIGHFLDKRV